MNSIDTMNTLYHIVDGNGNYYRVNEKGQLVVADSREEAGVFNFTEANQRIGGGKKAHFYSVIPAEEQEEELLPEVDLREIIRLLPVPDPASEPEEEPPAAEAKEEPYCMKGMDWHEYLQHFCYLAAGVKDYYRELKEALSDIDKQICDILHYIEFYELDGAESVRMVELLKECREQRRDVKDETVRVEYFQKVLGTASNLTKVQDSLKQINKLETRKYHPRKLPELFKLCPEKTVRQNKLMRAFADNTCLDVEQTWNEYEEDRHDRPEEEMTMEYTKQTTIFDNKENDWLQFAKQQADFYANAEQYIYNLQTGLREIDEEIEQVLAEVENANYNCAQGYQVFKHLKEMRLTRKAKQKELECLYILTQGLDCRWMADNMLACVGEINAVYEEKGKEEKKVIVEVEMAG